MRFGQPLALTLLAGVVLLALGHVWSSARRRRYAVRFTNLDLLRLVLPRCPGWRRTLVAALALASIATMVLALAHPQRTATASRQQARVMLVIDISPSMLATDVAPSRLEAAQDAAASFLDLVPESFAVGLTTFAGTARVISAPTTDRAFVRRALDRLDVESETAIGEGIIVSLDAIATGEASTTAESASAPGHLLVLSDGAQTMGIPVADAIDAARAARVVVSTISYGTADGTVVLGGQRVEVPPDPETLEEIAHQTGGEAFQAATAEELEAAYEAIGTSLVRIPVVRDLTRPFVALAAALLFASAALSAYWLGRLA